MKNIFKYTLTAVMSFMLMFVLVACGNSNNNNEKAVPEKVSLTTATLSEVEFENAKTVNLEQKGDMVEVKGAIDAMSKSQKNAYGVDEVTHVVSLKFMFDKERTLSSFEIKGNTTKVFSDDKTVENYVGSLTEMLDNESGEDSYVNLILSANTKDYTLKSKYTDGTTSTIKLKISATLATAAEE